MSCGVSAILFAICAFIPHIRPISTKINLKKLISTEMPGLMTGFLKMRTAVIFKVIKADGSKKIGNLNLYH